MNIQPYKPTQPTQSQLSEREKYMVKAEQDLMDLQYKYNKGGMSDEEYNKELDKIRFRQDTDTDSFHYTQPTQQTQPQDSERIKALLQAYKDGKLSKEQCDAELKKINSWQDYIFGNTQPDASTQTPPDVPPQTPPNPSAEDKYNKLLEQYNSGTDSTSQNAEIPVEPSDTPPVQPQNTGEGTSSAIPEEIPDSSIDDKFNKLLKQYNLLE